MMSMDEFRAEMERFRIYYEEQGQDLKDCFLVLERLHGLYRKFDAAERRMADQVFCEWLLSDDASIRWIAKGMVWRLEIKQAVPTLRVLAKRLALIHTPQARNELEMVEQRIAELTAGTPGDA